MRRCNQRSTMFAVCWAVRCRRGPPAGNVLCAMPSPARTRGMGTVEPLPETPSARPALSSPLVLERSVTPTKTFLRSRLPLGSASLPSPRPCSRPRSVNAKPCACCARAQAARYLAPPTSPLLPRPAYTLHAPPCHSLPRTRPRLPFLLRLPARVPALARRVPALAVSCVPQPLAVPI